jgi:hypothetical protein
VIMRIREPKTTALIFASGKMVCSHSCRLLGAFVTLLWHPGLHWCEERGAVQDSCSEGAALLDDCPPRELHSPCFRLQYAMIIKKIGYAEVLFKVSRTILNTGWLELRPLRPTLCLQDFKIQNIVGSCDVRFPIRLEGLNYQHGLFCSVSAFGPVPILRVQAANVPATPPVCSTSRRSSRA